ncbi:MAG: Wadjet anti-phage system protein JetD domain-containing protein [Aggregatilineales bacterium]
MPNTFRIFGSGFNVQLLSEVDWITNCPLFYWGDPDAQGFQIRSMLRASLPNVVSVMMDMETFEIFRSFSILGTPSPIKHLPGLTTEEHALFIN